MSQISDVTALSGYQVQSQNLASQISTLQPQVTAAQNFYNSLVAQIQQVDSSGGQGSSTEINLAQQTNNAQNTLQNLQAQLSSSQSQKTNLDQIIAQLQTNITAYDTPSPISSTNPSTSSDTAHNIATGFTSALSSIPKTDLYIGLGILGLLLLI